MAIDRAQMIEYITKIVEEGDLDKLSLREVRVMVEQKMGLERDALKSEQAMITAIIDEVLGDLDIEGSPMSTALRSEAAHDHSRVLAQCFAGADHAPGAAGFTAQLEDKIWQQASSWKGYCERLAIKAALFGHEGCFL